MRKENKVTKWITLLLAAAMLMGSFPLAFGEEAAVEAPVEEVTPAQAPAQEEVTVKEEKPAEPAAPTVIEVEPVVVEPETRNQEKDPEPTAEPTQEPEPTKEPEPTAEPENKTEPETEPIVVEVETPAETEVEEVAVPADDEEDEEEEEVFSDEEELFEFDEDDAGTVSDELLEQFNNPETFENMEFNGTADIVLKESKIFIGQPVTLQAKISEVEMSYRIVWEANDGDSRGWYTIAGGPEYTFTVTEDILDREYRVVLFAVD